MLGCLGQPDEGSRSGKKGGARGSSSFKGGRQDQKTCSRSTRSRADRSCVGFNTYAAPHISPALSCQRDVAASTSHIYTAALQERMVIRKSRGTSHLERNCF